MNLFNELKRRKVIRTTLGYLAAAVLLAVFAELIVAGFGLPREIAGGVVILGLVALPLVVGLAWTFDLTPEGVEFTGATPQLSRVAIPWRRVMLPLVATILIVLATVSFVALRKTEAMLNQPQPDLPTLSK